LLLWERSRREYHRAVNAAIDQYVAATTEALRKFREGTEMKHGYLVSDNDTPLVIAHDQAEAEAYIDAELGRIEATIRRAHIDWSEEAIQAKLNDHNLYWVMVPYVVPIKKELAWPKQP
jgi:hypothetical protein